MKVLKRQIHWRQLLVIAVMALGLGAATTRIAFAQQSRMRAEMQEFHVFLRNHPNVSAQLQRNPRLVANEHYLEEHPALRTFLRQHPGVRREILDHPSAAFNYGYWDDHRPVPGRR
jgi:phage-related protein